MLYQTYQAHVDSLWPLRQWSEQALPWLGPWRKLRAALEVFNLAQVTHRRPPFGIQQVSVHDQATAVTEETVASTPFADLLHFRKPGVMGQPRLLIAAPMSGHFATLLRETVRTCLRDHDVYITDWRNARDVPMAAGRFGLDEYIAHVIDFLSHLGSGSHLMSICQPCPAALAATAVMAEDGHPAVPHSLTLMAGPVDCRISPTEVNKLAMTKPIEWFERHLIARVPWRYPGAMRPVYPGFVQLTAFVSMNLQRHVDSLQQMYRVIADGLPEQADTTRSFYEEYFAVADLPAEFYLETVQKVFQTHDLPRGELTFRGRKVRPEAITRTALLTVEGERDDICALGQTLAAHDLCTHLRPTRKMHYVQAGVGHYGVFSGRKWDQQIYPMVRDMVHRMN
jgi:polyhydroxyalkanoate depolymerase